MGDPRNIYGLPYNVGTCTAQGVSIRRVIKLVSFYIGSNFTIIN